ncbi:catabolite control protein A [Leuconostoc lactis]|uniref:catabolite control protein A n=1 Tax=Leuconostoc lactis TaxID=1246 RepID=UPI00020DA0E6|nr:catabolite control protein A [Leuconostoc lactis]MCT3114766.1 catabolite control protein A [Leuconostoc lactis]ORI85521.1 catabolite control protein A [Leuconostoc lactis]ORI87730.1 catabolite control protein A [Leuconostoc lactis]
MQKKSSATIYDVANRVGVSLATVSRVVNGNSNVRDSTKRKVLDAIEELGYHPNAVARGLASKKTTTIGVVMPDVTDMYYAELARGIDDVANMYHYDVLLTNTDEDPVRETMAVNNLSSKQVDGIIFMGNELDREVLNTIAAADAPVVLAGSVDSEGKLPSVNINYVAAIQEATETVINHGHRRVALVTGPMSHAINRLHRLVGYQAALEAAGIEFDEALLFTAHQDYAAGMQIAEKVLQAGANAVIAYDDEVALGIMNYVQEHGQRVPEDFEIITSNDTKFAIVTRPELTSIGQPKYDIGAVAMRMLTKLMNNEIIDDTQVQLPHTLERRGTTLD